MENKSFLSSYAKPIIIVVALLVILGGGFFLFRNFTNNSNSDEELITPTEELNLDQTIEPTVEEVIEVTATPEATPTGLAKKTPTPSVTADGPTKQPTVTVPKGALTVSVLNGSGKVGEAAKAADLLRNKGFAIGSVGNADNYDYEETIVKVKKDKMTSKQSIIDALKGTYVVSANVVELDASSTADAEVIVGKKTI